MIDILSPCQQGTRILQKINIPSRITPPPILTNFDKKKVHLLFLLLIFRTLSLKMGLIFEPIFHFNQKLESCNFLLYIFNQKLESGRKLESCNFVIRHTPFSTSKSPSDQKMDFTRNFIMIIALVSLTKVVERTKKLLVSQNHFVHFINKI